MLDSRVEKVARMRIARIGDDRSVTQRPRSGLRRSLAYRNDTVPGGDERHQVGNGIYAGSMGRIADDHPGQIGGTLQCREDFGNARGASAIEYREVYGGFEHLCISYGHIAAIVDTHNIKWTFLPYLP